MLYLLQWCVNAFLNKNNKLINFLIFIVVSRAETILLIELV